jgi:predicted nucleic acid-binding protein
MLAAIDNDQQTGASFRDAMILRSAKELDCQTLYTDDLHPGQTNAGVQVSNQLLG